MSCRFVDLLQKLAAFPELLPLLLTELPARFLLKLADVLRRVPEKFFRVFHYPMVTENAPGVRKKVKKRFSY
jgi:hypothetical protein